jgi:hypothetical protein
MVLIVVPATGIFVVLVVLASSRVPRLSTCGSPVSSSLSPGLPAISGVGYYGNEIHMPPAKVSNSINSLIHGMTSWISIEIVIDIIYTGSITTII